MPDIQFVNSPRTEEERIKFTYKFIASGFYEKHGFVVLPEHTREVEQSVVVIYPKLFEYRPIKVDNFQREWAVIENDFWQVVDEYFPRISQTYKAIEVRLTRYGTVASGEKMNVASPDGKKAYYLRIDADLSQLAAMIINSILWGERRGLGITWTKREALMDFVMTRPTMKKLFPKYRPVMSQLARIPSSVRKQAERYVAELGVNRVTQEFELVGGKVQVRGKMVGKELTKQDKKVMKLLIEHKGELVTYDELADTVWGVGEFKTYWALNKLVERMRPKLKKLGIEGKRLESVRGQGYLLR
jgi:hypothetical protein